MIKTFETFLSQYWDIINPKNIFSNLIPSTWNGFEASELRELSFKNKTRNTMEFHSVMNEFIISIAKYWDESTKQEIYKTFIISGELENGVQKERKREFSIFGKLLEYVKENIPDEDIQVNKYNL